MLSQFSSASSYLHACNFDASVFLPLQFVLPAVLQRRFRCLLQPLVLFEICRWTAQTFGTGLLTKGATMNVHINRQRQGHSFIVPRENWKIWCNGHNAAVWSQAACALEELQEESRSNSSSFLHVPNLKRGTTWEFLRTSPSRVCWDLFLEFRWTRERVEKWKEQMRREGNQ